MQHVKKITKEYHCAICQAICGRVNLQIDSLQDSTANPEKRFFLNIDKFSQAASYKISETEFNKMADYYLNNAFDKIFDLNKEWIPFYCEKCGKNYCKNHWDRTMSFDEGYYDAEYGVCPLGHKRMLYD